jgi:hypothetical protein
MSYNNKDVKDAVPGGVPDAASPVASRLTQWRAEILPQLETVRTEMTPRLERLVPPQVLSSPLLRNATQQLLPLLGQLNPAVDELADGTRDFTPTPQESRAIIAAGYRVPGTLLVRPTVALPSPERRRASGLPRELVGHRRRLPRAWHPARASHRRDGERVGSHASWLVIAAGYRVPGTLLVRLLARDGERVGSHASWLERPQPSNHVGWCWAAPV